MGALFRLTVGRNISLTLTLTDRSVGGVAWPEVESVQLGIDL
jgi:hypothetical protein